MLQKLSSFSFKSHFMSQRNCFSTQQGKKKKNLCFHDFDRNKCCLEAEQSNIFKFSYASFHWGEHPLVENHENVCMWFDWFNRQMCFGNITLTQGTLRNYVFSVNILQCSNFFLIITMICKIVLLLQMSPWCNQRCSPALWFRIEGERTLWLCVLPQGERTTVVFTRFYFVLLLLRPFYSTEGLAGWDNIQSLQCCPGR